MFRNPFGRVRSSCSARRFRPENWTERHELSRASFSNRWHCGQNCGQSQMRPAYKQKNPTISNVKSLDLWSEWRESNSRPLEPHSSALPKLRYTRISTVASLPKRGDKKYYTQVRPFCQQIFRLFLVFSEKSPIFTRIRAFLFFAVFSVFLLLRRAVRGRVPAAGADTGR